MKLEPELCAEFMAVAFHRPSPQILHDMMCEFVQRQRETREYLEYGGFLHRKVKAGWATTYVGLGRSNDEIEAEFSARRTGMAYRV